MARKIQQDYPNVDKAMYPNPRDALTIEEEGQTISLPEEQQRGITISQKLFDVSYTRIILILG